MMINKPLFSESEKHGKLTQIRVNHEKKEISFEIATVNMNHPSKFNYKQHVIDDRLVRNASVGVSSMMIYVLEM